MIRVYQEGNRRKIYVSIFNITHFLKNVKHLIKNQKITAIISNR